MPPHDRVIGKEFTLMITGKAPYISTVSLLNRPVNTAAAGAVSTPGGTEPGIDPISKTDKVHLSDPGLNLLPGDTQESDPARAEKVQAIKQAIEEKRYHIESRKIADKLLREASELLGTLTGYPEDPMKEEPSAAESSGQPSSDRPEGGKDQSTSSRVPGYPRSTRSYTA